MKEMLATRLIHPSNSPFSSPILLLKKKDGSLQFCTNYCALNTVTIKDQFTIPTVDDMLDKLHGATYLLSWTFVQVTIRFVFIPKTFIKWPSAPTMAIMNIWWCLLGFVMTHPLFKLLWTLYSNHTYRSSCWFSLMTYWFIAKGGRSM